MSPCTKDLPYESCANDDVGLSTSSVQPATSPTSPTSAAASVTPAVPEQRGDSGQHLPKVQVPTFEQWFKGYATCSDRTYSHPAQKALYMLFLASQCGLPRATAAKSAGLLSECSRAAALAALDSAD